MGERRYFWASVRGQVALLEARVTTVGLVMVSLAYFYAAIKVAGRTHLWMDEVLAVQIAREPSISKLFAALWHGSDFCPPTYHVLLHGLVSLTGAGSGLIVWRMPSILGVYGAGLCVYGLMRRWVERYWALLAFALALSASLFQFAVQARPYALVAFGMAAALLLWCGYGDGGRPRWRCVAIWAVMSACLALHFYGLTVVAAVLICEAIWRYRHGQWRRGVWLAVALTIPVELALAPLFLHLARFNRGDSGAPGFYAKPGLTPFLDTVFNVLCGGRDGSLFALALLAIVVVGLALRGSARRPLNEGEGPDGGDTDKAEAPVTAIAALFIVPFLVFGMSIVTKSFVERYTVAAATFPGMALAAIASRVGVQRLAALGLTVVAAAGLLVHSRVHDSFNEIGPMLRSVNAPGRVVVGEGLLYIELMHVVDAETGAKLVYVFPPAGEQSPDPTNEHEVERLAEIRPEYRVSRYREFLSSSPSFYLLSRPGHSTDTTTTAIAAAGYGFTLVARAGDASLFLISPPAVKTGSTLER